MRQTTLTPGIASAAPKSLPELLRVDRAFGVIDVCLVFIAIAMHFSGELTLLTQATFLLLMVGACYWRFAGIVARTLLWAGIAATQLIAAVSLDDEPSSTLLTLPILTVMLVIVYLLAARRHSAERTRTHAELHDQLTRLPNRATFMRRLDERLSNAPAGHRAVAVISLDIDGFKTVNDEHGHAAADRLLVELAARLQRCVRSDDTVARVGGDEFLIVIGSDPGMVPRIAERLAQAVEEPFVFDAVEIRVTGSLGVALSEDPSPKVRDDLVRHADAAMRRVKSEGRSGYEVFSPLTVAA